MSDNVTAINWYPGHMTKARRMMQEDIKPLVYILENDFNEKTLAEGKAAVSTVYGYPCGLEVSGSTDGKTVLLAMKIIVSGPEGQISVK